MLRSPAPALVVATPAAVGEEVAAGAPVLVLESMKMETVLTAPFAARVKELLVSTGSQVETGAALVRLEPVGDGDEEVAVQDVGPALDLPGPEEGRSAAVRATRARAALTAVILGYDVPPRDQDAALTDYLAARDELADQGVSVVADEMALLGTFADLAELSRNRPADEERHTELRVHSSREHFHTFLQSLDVERGGLPEHFSDRLLRVLRHYGVEDLERTPAMEEAVFRIFLAQQRSAPEVAVATAILGCWSAEPPPTGDLAVRARQVLEVLGRATQLRFPVVGDLARSVRFRWFDQPAVDAERADVLAGVREALDALVADGGLPDRAARIDALAAIPEQIVRFLAERLEKGVPADEPMLEVLARRHYREYDLHDLAGHPGGGPPVRRRRVHARRPGDAAGVDARHPPRARRPHEPAGPGDRRPGGRAPRGRRGRRRPLPALARRARVGRRGQRAAPAARRRAAVRGRRTPPVRRRVRRGPPPGRLLRLPARQRRQDGRGRPDPRDCTRWSAGG